MPKAACVMLLPKKILIEITLLKAVQARQAMSIDSVLTKLRDLQSSGGGSGSPAASGAVAQKQTPRTTPLANSMSALDAPPLPQGEGRGEGLLVRETTGSAAPPSASVEAVDLAQLWHDVMEAAGRASPFAKSFLIRTHPVSFTKTTFTLGVDPVFAEEFSIIDQPKNRQLIETKLREAGHHNITVRIIQAASPEGWARPADAIEPQPAERPAVKPAPIATAKAAAPEPPRPAPVQLSKEDFKNDP